jgi:hypothetical protein
MGSMERRRASWRAAARLLGVLPGRSLDEVDRSANAGRVALFHRVHAEAANVEVLDGCPGRHEVKQQAEVMACRAGMTKAASRVDGRLNRIG